MTAIRFGEDFGLRDAHIEEMLGVQDLAARLQSIYLGSSDTGWWPGGVGGTRPPNLAGPPCPAQPTPHPTPLLRAA